MIKYFFIFNKNKLYLILLTSIIIIDTSSKLIAKVFLPYHKVIEIFSYNLILYLTYNFNASGTQVLNLLKNSVNINLFLVLTSLQTLILGIYFILCKKWELKFIIKIIIGFLIYFFLFLIILIIVSQLKTDIYISNYFVSVFTKIGTLVLVFSLFNISKNKIIRVLWILILSTGLSNLLNHFYPPFYIIDFVQFELFTQYFGFGVFNFADLINEFTLILIACYILLYVPIRYLLIKIVKKNTAVSRNRMDRKK